MDIFEEAVLEYLTHEGKVFVCPQAPLKGANPDFIALDFHSNPPKIAIVEVSSAYGLSALAKKLEWYQAHAEAILREGHFSRLPGLAIDERSPMVVMVFVKQNKVAWLRDRLKNSGRLRIEVVALEDVFATLLDWHKKCPHELIEGAEAERRDEP